MLAMIEDAVATFAKNVAIAVGIGTTDGDAEAFDAIVLSVHDDVLGGGEGVGVSHIDESQVAENVVISEGVHFGDIGAADGLKDVGLNVDGATGKVVGAIVSLDRKDNVKVSDSSI